MHNDSNLPGETPKDLRDLLGELSEERDHAPSDAFDTDAAEGLATLSPGEQLKLIDRLNHGLRQDLHKKRSRRKMPEQSMPMLIIVTVLLLIVMAYLVIAAIQ